MISIMSGPEDREYTMVGETHDVSPRDFKGKVILDRPHRSPRVIRSRAMTTSPNSQLDRTPDVFRSARAIFIGGSLVVLLFGSLAFVLCNTVSIGRWGWVARSFLM